MQSRKFEAQPVEPADCRTPTRLRIALQRILMEMPAIPGGESIIDFGQGNLVTLCKPQNP